MASPVQQKVFLDMSPLDTPSRLRGVGQYVIGLASAIEALQQEVPRDFAVDGLACFDAQGRPTGADGLAYRGSFHHPDGFNTKAYRERVRHGLGRAAQARGGNLVHVTDPEAIVRDKRVPFVLTCYDLIPLVLHRQYLGKAPWARYIRYRRERAYYGMARRIVAISEATKRDLVQYLGIDERIVDVTYLGVDHARFQPQPAVEGERAALMKKYDLKRAFLFYLGAYDPRKNIQLLVRAFAMAQLHKDFDLVLGGAILSYDKVRLEAAIAAEAGISDAIRIIGFIDEADVAAFYRCCHLHVFPSAYEGFGLPVAEAMACGAPTVTTTATSLPEVAGDGASLVPAGEADALASELKALAFDATRRSALNIAGPKVAARFSWRECAKQTLLAYESALRMG
jgi:glycosyltransferase involved in cell wall biosynthesis